MSTTPEQLVVEARATLPIFSLLKGLFDDPKMFDSYASFQEAGFDLVDRASTKVLAGSHDRTKGYLFKKYDNGRSEDDQLRNYMRRIEGARLLRDFLAARGYVHVTAPKKWLYELPSSFPRRYLLVAQKLDILSKEKTQRRYKDIDKDQMQELATVLFYFRGLNSTSSNLPFTEDDQIAFIDTERWARNKDYMRRVGDRVSSKRRKQAAAVYDELLRQGERPFQSAFL